MWWKEQRGAQGLWECCQPLCFGPVCRKVHYREQLCVAVQSPNIGLIQILLLCPCCCHELKPSLGWRQAQSTEGFRNLELYSHLPFPAHTQALQVSCRVVSAGAERARPPCVVASPWLSLQACELKNNHSTCKWRKFSSGAMSTEGCPFLQPEPGEIAPEVPP